MRILQIALGGALALALAGLASEPAQAMPGVHWGAAAADAVVVPAYVKNGRRYFNGQPLADYYRRPDDYRYPYRYGYQPVPYSKHAPYPPPLYYPQPGFYLEFGS